jgi:hypothetical protein
VGNHPRVRLRRFALLLLIGCVLTVGPTVAAEPSLTLEEYTARLSTFRAAVDEPRTIIEWPTTWRVRVGTTDLVVPTEVLLRDLAQWRTQQDQAARSRLLARLVGDDWR